MEEVAVEKKRVAGGEFDVHRFHHLCGFVHALGIRAGLVAKLAVLDAAHFVRTFQNLQAAVRASVGIDCDKS